MDAGEEIIDVAEYYGSESIEAATFFRYVQIKHSTHYEDKPWPPSGLAKTLRKFAKRYTALAQRLGSGTLDNRFEFVVLSNRPINTKFMEAIEDANTQAVSRHPNDLQKLERYTSLRGEKLAAFCKFLSLKGGQESYQFQRGSLAQEAKGYLVGDDYDAPVQLKELVTKKALPGSARDPAIRKTDVLRALGTTEDRLFPAPPRIEHPESSIPRTQEPNLVAQIAAATVPVIVHAAGGVGKSVFSQRIKFYLPNGSIVVVYDCYGNGDYKQVGSPRHRHKDALVQIANELAALGLCDPLIPSSRADTTDYLRAFGHRLRQGIAAVKAENKGAILCVAIDAADSAELAAKEFGDERSFVRDLLREPLPDGVKLVALSRTERLADLDPPSKVIKLELEPFSREETATLLRTFYPEASESDIDEFHRLTSHNPRVQATALGQGRPLPSILRSLGPNPTTVDDAISSLLVQAIDELRERAGSAERPQINAICAGLAILRPLVPISVLAAVSQVDASAIRSFAVDFGRPLLVTDDAIQFRDEPVESWFRARFRPKAKQLSAFIATLEPLASKSAYVASTLPQLMLEAGQFNEVVELALSSSGLPTSSPIEKRDVELQRLQFALKASLRAKRYVESSKLALKAGEEMAGDSRQQELLQSNTDLVAALLEPHRIQEIVSRRTFGGQWFGAHHAYEAGSLSPIKEFHGDARSKLRMAYEWLKHWSRLSKEERIHEQIEDEDVAEIAMARLNVDGADACAAELRKWIPRDVSFWAGSILAKRLIDHGRYDALDELAISATNDLCLQLAITLQLRKIHLNPPKESVERTLRLLLNSRIRVKDTRHGYENTVLPAITAVVEAGYAHSLRSKEILASLLQRYLPESPPERLASQYEDQRFPVARAYSLHAALTGKNLQLNDLAHPRIRSHLENKKKTSAPHEVQEFKARIGAVLPWHKLWAEVQLSPTHDPNLAGKIAAANEASKRASNFSLADDSLTTDEIARIWFDILIDGGEGDDSLLEEFLAWTESVRRPLFTPTWTQFARISARTITFRKFAHGFAQKAFELIKEAREDAVSKGDSYIDLSRAILSIDKWEANEYFNKAVEVASKLGDEVLDRWQAMLNLAGRAAQPKQPVPRAAYQLARCAELTYHYVARDKHFDWEDTVAAIGDLCPSSCFAILSRWRDRNFGWRQRLFPVAVQHLADQHRIDPTILPALLGFRANWDYFLLLRLALDSCESHSGRERILGQFISYMRLDSHDANIWTELKAIVNSYGLVIRDIDQIIELATKKEKSQEHRSGVDYHDYSKINEKLRDKDWRSIFSGLDLYTPEGLSVAYGRFRTYEPPYYFENFLSEIFERLPVGKEVSFIRAFAEVPEFELYEFRELLTQFPDTWKPRMSVRTVLADVVETLCRRHCMEITKSKYHQPLPLQSASELTRVPEEQLIETVLDAISRTTETFSSGRFFTLTGLLVAHLSHDGALDALDFGLTLFDDTLRDDDGDGPWAVDLEPPSDVHAAIAGYVWATLGAPEAGSRWEAAHVVRNLCAVGGQPSLGYLFDLAKNGSGGPFVDARLHFYNLHARQWLMIAFDRAALDIPEALAAHSDLLIQFALEDEPHVLIRHFAAKALLSLSDRNQLTLDQEIITRLRTINTSHFSPISTARHQRHVGRFKADVVEAKRFRFGYDMSRYWFESLGDCFAKTSPDIEIEAEKIICDDWRLSENGHWDTDERARRGILGGRESYHSHGSYPKVDGLNFYLSYHALMVTAGKLLATVPLHQDPEDPDDEFEDWLSRHLLTRQDGRWLFDRRDPIPLEWPSWKDEDEKEDWRWSVGRLDFDRLLGLDEARLNLWGRWSFVSGRRVESAHITSALVSSERSAALLRALQTATNPHDYRIPSANDDLEIDEPDFQIRGWVEDEDDARRLDEFDPWAGEIRYPPLKPAKFIQDLLNLEPDAEFRVWQMLIEGKWTDAAWSQIWSEFQVDDEDSPREHGRRLQVSHPFITQVLCKTNMDLIIEVEIERRTHRRYYERDDNGNLGYAYPYAKIFCFKADGQWQTLR